MALVLPTLATDRARRAGRAGQAGQAGRGRASSPSPAAPEEAPQEAPLVAVVKERGALRLAACDARAAALGLRPGMSLADARALHPGLAVVDADPEAQAATLARLADWGRRWTPLVATLPPDAIVLDVTGSAHLFGGEAAMRADAVARLGRLGFHARAAIAGTPEAAAALARAADGAIVATGEEERALRPLPVSALAVAPSVVEGLAKLGLRRIEDVALRPRAPFAARFGADLIARIDAAFGRTRSAIGARLEAPPYVVERRFFEPILTQEDVSRTLARLADELAGMLTTHGEGARALELSLFRVDGAVRRIRVGASRPTRDPARMALLFRERLAGERDELDIGYGFDVVRLTALSASRLDEAARRLDGSVAGEDLARLVDTLGARLGPERVRRLAACDTHWPEDAAALLAPGTPPLRDAVRWTPPLPDAPADRPIRLFARPEPIEAVATVPDGPPLRFRWRRVLHETAAYEGPERIAPAWWDGAGLTRDYFRAEDVEGRRFWLFREGLYGRETAAPRWYVHGLFG
ncbi:DNA polymerase Y family protein [Salinarimonas sp.]|uniref:Y-family DNA polymerase n=1 Tax=Salinarimonas sp. TaxID=2766526 RepID=UPI0032D8D335